MKKKLSTQKRKLTSNIADRVASDVGKLIKKYTKESSDENTTEYGQVLSDRGFYFIFINRDENEDDKNRLTITELAHNISLEDLRDSMVTVFNGHVNGTNTIKYTA